MYNIKEINYTYLAGIKKKSIKTLLKNYFLQGIYIYKIPLSITGTKIMKPKHILNRFIYFILYSTYTCIYIHLHTCISKNDTSLINSAILLSITLSSLISLNGHFYRNTNVSRASITVNCEVYDVGLRV